MTEKNFKSILESKAVMVVLSLAIALVLWLYVTGTEGVTVEKEFRNIKVNYTGTEELAESSGLLVTGSDVDTINLTVTGLRRDIAQLSDRNLSVSVNLSSVKSEGYYTLAYEVNYPNGVIADNFTSVHGSPETVAVTVDRLSSRKVEVKGSFTGSAADGYLAQETLVFNPMTVKISGPKALVDQVDCAWVTITRENVDASLCYMTSFTLLDAEGKALDTNGLTLDTDEVEVTLNIYLTKTVALTATVIPGGGATEANAIVTVEPSSITLAGNAETLDAINQIVVDTVKLANVNPIYELDEQIIPIPNDTVNLSGVSTASVRVEIQNLATATFTADKKAVAFTNVPEGFTPECITETLPVLLRGSREALDTVAAGHIRAVVDLTDCVAAPGIYNVTAKISVDGNAELGAVGEYKVYIKLNAK